MTYLVPGIPRTGPAAEDEGVVHGDHGNDIDTLGLESVEVLEVGWKVVNVASGLHEGR